MKKYLFIILIITLFGCQKSTQKTQIVSKNDTIKQEDVEECQEFIELHSISYLAKEYGESKQYIIANVKINLWKNNASKGRWPAVGKLLPGSRALIIETGVDEYKVKSPFDNSVGWISNIQVSRTLFQDINTYEPCKK